MGIERVVAGCALAFRSLLTFNFCLLILWCGGVWYFSEFIPVFERPIPGQRINVNNRTVFIRDATFNHPYKPSAEQSCPMIALSVICVAVPVACFTLGACIRRKPAEAAEFFHGVFLSWSCVSLAIDLIKNYTGTVARLWL